MTVAVYPGSFDPVTFGHLDILARAAEVFDRLIVAVLTNPRKAPLLSSEERIDVLRRSIADELPALSDRVDIEAFDGLTVEFCRAKGVRSMVRGLRAISDFETEMLLAHNNRRLAPDIDTVFFMTSLEQSYVSSSLVREIAQFGGDISPLVPAPAAEALGRALHRAPVGKA
jgi:pantetheine-phosphate adenylyltransferase